MGETRYFFTDTSIYIPDADSFDDYENLELGIERGTTPVQETCEGDGIETHAPELPSKYCVRVSEPGFVFVPALRLAFGTWLTPDIALALAYQWHFTVQPDTFFGAQSLTLEGHYIVLGDRASGGSLALVAELGAGRTETPVEQAPFDASVSMHKPPVNALTGPLEAAAGLAVRYALTPRASLIASLRFGGRFPATQLVTGLTAALEYGL